MSDQSQAASDDAGPDVLEGLRVGLDAADDLPLDERLALLRRTEEEIARTLEGLDGL